MNANNTPDGVIGLQLVHSNNEKQHIRVRILRIAITIRFLHSLKSQIQIQDSVYVLAAAVKELINNETITEAPKACEDTDVIWESGRFITKFQLRIVYLWEKSVAHSQVGEYSSI